MRSRSLVPHTLAALVLLASIPLWAGLEPCATPLLAGLKPCATEARAQERATEARAQDPPPLAGLLRSAADYLAKYEQQFSAVVSEELYVQAARNDRLVVTGFVRLRSDVLVVNLGEGEWAGFRDVFEVDGRAVRDRDERLANLFLKPTAGAMDLARQIASEGARFNVNTPDRLLKRTINTPTVALMFLRRQNQFRSTFKIEDAKTEDGRRLVVVRFQESAVPRMINSPDATPARGRLWIEPDSGRVVRTELVLESLGSSGTITVTYAAQPKLDLWPPASMDELYRLPRGQTIDGHATYSNFRKFSVEVTTAIKTP
jgi:hypothetical protein